MRRAKKNQGADLSPCKGSRGSKYLSSKLLNVDDTPRTQKRGEEASAFKEGKKIDKSPRAST